MTRLEPTWRRRAPVLRLLEAFPDASQLRFVGGCVRDALLGIDSQDLDLATTYLPDEVMAFLKEAGLKPLPTGIDHGTVTVFIDKERFEITTLRKDIQTDGRRAVVGFTKDWQEDALRRDFTFNALYLDVDGVLFDPWDGAADLEAGRVRFIGDARERVREDALRILRYFRFVARFQKGPLDPHAFETCQAQKELLLSLSRERISQEICALLQEKKARALAEVLSYLAHTGIWETLFEVPPHLPFWKKGLMLEGQEGEGPSLRRRLALLFWPTPRALEGLRLPRVFLSEIHHLYQSVAGENELRVVLYEFGKELASDWLFLRHTLGLLAHSRPETLPQAYALLNGPKPPPFPLTGHDFKHLGLSGPALGGLLKEVQRWWIFEDFLPDRQACLTHGLAHFQALEKNEP